VHLLYKNLIPVVNISPVVSIHQGKKRGGKARREKEEKKREG
jgi:hypothetical protein